MATQRIDYTAEAVEAARSVLLELSHLLGEYRDDIVVIGGWVPDLLLSRGEIRHVGPTYVADFEGVSDANDRELLQRDAYERVADLLRRLAIP